jgi:transposase-like protein
MSVSSTPSETSTFNYDRPETAYMSKTLEDHCPVCAEEQPFYQAASTEVHLGKKVKWHCPECDYGFVRIDGTVDTAAA